MSQPAPTASGTLASTPLANLLIYALDRKLTGSLVFEEPSGAKHAVYFARGAPALVGLSVAVAPLGELGVEAGVVPRERLEAALAAGREQKQKLGRILIEWGLLDEARLELLLQDQISRRVRRLALLPRESAYGYYAGVNFLESMGGPAAPCPPLPLIWRVLKASGDPAKTREIVQRLGNSELRFHTDAPLRAFEFDGPERAFVEVLSAKPQRLEELRGRGLLDPDHADALVCLLALLRQFDTGSDVLPMGAEPRASHVPAMRQSSLPRSPEPSRPSLGPSPSPSTPPAEDNEFRRELKARAAATGQSYYELLGVATDAPAPAIASAYFQLAKKWHPDKIGPDNADLRDLAERVFARMSEANQVLADPERRSQYDELLKSGEGAAEEQEQVQRVVRAATNFQKAQVLLKRNNLAGAEEAARAALADAPDEADHIALVAWLDANKPGADLASAFRTIDRAAKSEMANLRIRWYRGQLLKRLGRGNAAMEDFRFIVEKDPRNVDAQREIRLQELNRGRKSEIPGATPARGSVPAEPPKTGILGKFFKK
ncbi:MAG TPA: DnaJ domain-containing protein [Polyangiaceae bacterium]